MVDLSSHFSAPKDSINWAKEAIGELNVAARDFFTKDSIVIFNEIDSDTGKNLRKVRLTKSLPGSFARKALESCTNIKHSFDQIMFSAQVALGNNTREIHFPWAQSPPDLKDRLKNKGIDQRLWSVIESHEPYPRGQGYSGGDDVIRALAQVANRKHTVNILTKCHISTTITPTFHISGGGIQILMPQWDLEKNEAVLFTWGNDCTIEQHGEYDFAFEVLLQDSKLPHPVNAIGSLSGFANKAQMVVKSIEAECIKIMSAP